MRYHLTRRSVGACLQGTCRDDPIPPGIYWIAVPWEESQFTHVPKPQHWQLWVDGMVSLGWVKVLKTVHHEPGSDILNSPFLGWLLAQGYDDIPIDWHLFQVTHDAPRWTTETGLGLPTVAPHGVQTTEDDTIQSPEPEPVSIWDKILPESTGGKVVVGAVALGGAALIIYGMTRQ